MKIYALLAAMVIAFSFQLQAQICPVKYLPDTILLKEFEVSCFDVYDCFGGGSTMCGYVNSQEKIVSTKCGFVTETMPISTVSVPDDQFVEVGAEQVAQTDWKVYPNPTTDVLFLESAQSVSKWMLFDLSGKMLRQQYGGTQRESIDLQSFPPGTYVLHWWDAEEMRTAKVVKR